ncbi:MAG: hypothetical protein L0228_04490 [Planctomycetes bacterium]|nr:hypothetical protein [Planctomycetota bacterium]
MRIGWKSVLFWIALVVIGPVRTTAAQERPLGRLSPAERRAGSGVRTATVHWVDVPLREAIGRLVKLFDEVIFVDRRVDPGERITLAANASSAEEILNRIAAQHEWGVSRLGRVNYLGPAAAARRLRRVAAARADDIAHLTGTLRAPFERKRSHTWRRLAEPRALVTALIEENGWRIADSERIPHDLWNAGSLPDLSLPEQLTILLIGFDLTFKIRTSERTIQIVALEPAAEVVGTDDAPRHRAPKSSARAPAGTKQVYSLRVADKPVGAVMRELARRLDWQIEFDEAAIQAAGGSLDARVSFAVEDVEQDKLLDAVLGPAGLTFRREGERIIVVPRDGAAQ